MTMTSTSFFTKSAADHLARCRAKQVADPLPEPVRARLNGDKLIKTDGYFSGGQEQEQEPSSVGLEELVEIFMADECDRLRGDRFDRDPCNRGDLAAVRRADDSGRSNFGGEVSENLRGLVMCVSERERIVQADTFKFVKAAIDEENLSCKDREKCFGGCLRRAVMKRLRTAGYNAAICKSGWDRCFEYPAGKYEYIDVIFEESTSEQERLIVDIDFRSQFEIAKPTTRYLGVSNTLPVLFIGKEDRLQRIIGVACHAANQALKKRGFHFPPWRKYEYMRAKWFSSYNRTVKEEPGVCSELQRSINPAQDKNITRKHSTGANKPPQITALVTGWEPPPVKPKASGAKVAGLASLLKEASDLPEFRRPEIG